MNVQLTGALSGERFVFYPGKVITCSEAQGRKLIEAGIAKEAPAGSQADGVMPESSKDLDPELAGEPKRLPGPTTRAAAARERAREEDGKGKSDPKGNPLQGPRTRQKPERADAPAGETPEAGEPVARCAGETKKGNPCLRAPLSGTDRCAQHPLED
jgi:hypothetical protein